jgi:auxin responsive GH3 family protein
VYEIIVTTCSGLYRYSCGDQFRVASVDACGVPTLDFVGRKGVSDLAGEKITEQHVTAALRELASDVPIANATFCATWAAPPHYVCVVEPGAAWSTAQRTHFADGCEAALRRLATRYDLKRGFGDLGPLVIRVVPAGTFARYRDARVAAGTPATQLKDKILHYHFEADVLAALDALASALA